MSSQFVLSVVQEKASTASPANTGCIRNVDICVKNNYAYSCIVYIYVIYIPLLLMELVLYLYTIVMGRETFYRRHIVPVTSCSEVKYVLKRVSFGSKECIKELKLECAYFLGQTS